MAVHMTTSMKIEMEVGGHKFKAFLMTHSALDFKLNPFISDADRVKHLE